MATPRSEFVLGQILPGSRYRLIREIGQGGMGTVFEVEHVELGKRFVLKAVLRRASTMELVQRLREEWKALGRIVHPNIVSVTDAGATRAGVPFFVMERLQGEDLQSRLRRERRLSLRDSVRIGCEMLDALDAAHQIGVVHRDVKPSNVFLQRQGSSKLLDFGVAKLLDSGMSLTRRGAAVGTPRYMSPEQACGEQVDSRSDLYAVGLLLFEMLAGQSPFEGANDREIFEAHLHRVPPLLSDVCPAVPEELSRLVARLLDKAPSQRPSSAGSALALLRAVRVALGSIPPGEPRGALDRFSSETLDAVRAVLSRSEREVDSGAPTVPDLHDSTPQALDTRTEVLDATTMASETRTSHTGTRTPPPVIAVRKGRKGAQPLGGAVSPWTSPIRMLAAGLVGGGVTVGSVVLALRSSPAESSPETAALAQPPVGEPAGPSEHPVDSEAVKSEAADSEAAASEAVKSETVKSETVDSEAGTLAATSPQQHAAAAAPSAPGAPRHGSEPTGKPGNSSLPQLDGAPPARRRAPLESAPPVVAAAKSPASRAADAPAAAPLAPPPVGAAPLAPAPRARSEAVALRATQGKPAEPAPAGAASTRLRRLPTSGL